MIQPLYNIGICTWAIVSAPKMIWRAMQSKVDRRCLLAKLGIIKQPIEQKSSGKCFWIHAVSLGETKAAEPLVASLKKSYPNARIIFSNATSTGLQCSQSNPHVSQSIFLPLDFSFMMRKLVKEIKPDLFLLIESDFWPNLLCELKKEKVPIVLANGKISQKSFSRMQKFSWFSKWLFSYFDYMCLQTEEYHERFLQLGVSSSSCAATGNIKFDIERKQLDAHSLMEFAHSYFLSDKQILAFSCTHEGEETIAIETMQKLHQKFPDYKFLLVPRHPYRFDKVEGMLKKQSIPYSTFKNPKDTPILYVNTVGVLDPIYQLSNIVVLCGSFVEGIGGHNLFEPLEGKAVLFYGPYVQDQPQLDLLIKEANAGVQVTSANLADTLIEYAQSLEKQTQLIDNSQRLLSRVKGASQKTYKKIQKYIGK